MVLKHFCLLLILVQYLHFHLGQFPRKHSEKHRQPAAGLIFFTKQQVQQ
uniref:Uncharacterized protein n=1 Tax=Anguilla anguilla TaxID=7936 RepID=A0A0E9TTN5_ANGAN